MEKVILTGNDMSYTDKDGKRHRVEVLWDCDYEEVEEFFKALDIEVELEY